MSHPPMETPRQTPLYSRHKAMQATMVAFHGWLMPSDYGSPHEEHQAVRQACGLFDISHLGVIDLSGPGVVPLLRRMLACDVARMPAVEEGQPQPGRYGLMLTDRGHVADDLIVHRLGADRFSLGVNADARNKDIAWLRIHAPSYKVEVRERLDLAVLALQGPKARACLEPILPPAWSGKVMALTPFQQIEQDGWRLSRVGYTGEEGFEIMIPEEWAEQVWNGLLRAGGRPAGLAARESLRMEAGLNRYGYELDEKHHPFESGVAWTIDWEDDQRDFIGRTALMPYRENPSPRKLVGLVLEGGPGSGRFPDRRQSVVSHGDVVGQVTSGGYSPTLHKGVAMARVESILAEGMRCQIAAEEGNLTAQVVSLPFVRLPGRSPKDQA